MDIDLDITKLTHVVAVGDASPLEEADLERIVVRKETAVQRISTRHQAVARLVAAGHSTAEIAAATGYSMAWIRLLKNDATFAELVRVYQQGEDIRLVYDRAEMINNLFEAAGEELLRRIEEEPEKMTNTQLKEIYTSAADRVGYGPQTTQNHNLNVNIGRQLDAARKRARERMIDITPTETEDDNSSHEE